MITSEPTNFSPPGEEADGRQSPGNLPRALIVRYALLTAAIFLPLIWAFVSVRNVYPLTAWNVMMAGGDLERGRSYCILSGETVSGETVEVRPIELTNALYSRTWTMVNATIANQSFRLASLHRDNAELIRRLGGMGNLSPGERIPDLLETWGRLYNERLPATSPQRLKAIRLDMYRWEGGDYSNYDNFIESWRKDL